MFASSGGARLGLGVPGFGNFCLGSAAEPSPGGEGFSPEGEVTTAVSSPPSLGLGTSRTWSKAHVEHCSLLALLRFTVAVINNNFKKGKKNIYFFVQIASSLPAGLSQVPQHHAHALVLMERTRFWKTPGNCCWCVVAAIDAPCAECPAGWKFMRNQCRGSCQVARSGLFYF